MIESKSSQESNGEITAKTVPLSFHPTFYHVFEKLQKWIARFPQSIDNSIMSDLVLLYLVAIKKFLDHRNPSHLFRLVLSVYSMQKRLLRSATFYSQQRHLEVRWIPTSLLFPFSSKPVLGCLIGFNVLDKYELFDEENILLALQKYIPELRLVRDSSYSHSLQHKNFKIFYFEIEKTQSTSFSFEEQRHFKNNIKEKIKNCIQKLSPAVYMGHNEEETYKNIVVLSKEIQTLRDLPQAYITFDQQTATEIVFRVLLVYISPFHRFSLKDCFVNCKFVSQRVVTVKHLDNHPIEAHIFTLHLPRDGSLLRSDGSLDFHTARQKISNLITGSIGEFRDYNGGIIITQQKLLQRFKESFSDIARDDSELLEMFFYAITPLEKQAVLHLNILSTLFNYFLENRTHKLSNRTDYSLAVYNSAQGIFIVVHSDHSSMIDTINVVLQEHNHRAQDVAYNFINTPEGYFFNCVFLLADDKNTDAFTQALRQSLDMLHQKKKDQQILRIALGYGPLVFSLDPRIGGDTNSGNILRLIFEGLTRINQNGDIENALAESIEISPNMQQYIFKLRRSLWNDGSPISAYDFEYAWKKILSPDFKTPFAYFFYPIKNAKEAKEGLVSPDEIGIHVLDDHKLIVELVRPTPYFLQFMAHQLYSPIHRLMDQQYPEWPYQCEKNYPCNGPFQLKINQPNQGYQLTKNPFYWEANQIVLDQVNLTEMKPAQAIRAFQNKEIDWIGNPFGSWNELYNNQQEGRLISLMHNMILWCVFNTSRVPFQHRKLRQAFAYAINRSKMICEELQIVKPAYSLLLYHQNSQLGFPDCDADKAQQLLTEALQELNLSKESIHPVSFSFVKQGIQPHIALCLKQQFKECLDIDLNLEPLSWNEVFSKMTKGDYQMGLMNWISVVDDPIYTLNVFKSAQEEINFAKWEDPDFQRLVNLSEQEINPFQRSFYLMKAEEILTNEMPSIPLFYPSYYALVSKNLNVNNGASLNITRSFLKKDI
jgi:oligopeptide transport system substrate-binding protein